MREADRLQAVGRAFHRVAHCFAEIRREWITGDQKRLTIPGACGSETSGYRALMDEYREPVARLRSRLINGADDLPFILPECDPALRDSIQRMVTLLDLDTYQPDCDGENRLRKFQPWAGTGLETPLNELLPKLRAAGDALLARAKSQQATTSTWTVPPELREKMKAKLQASVFNPQCEDAARVDAGLTLLMLYGVQLLPRQQELPNPLEHQPTLEIWSALNGPFERLAILAESRGIDSTPLRELVPCRTFAEAEQVRTLVERLDVVAQATARGTLQSPPDVSQEHNPDPPRRKPGGWTTGELCDEADIKHTVFGRIRERAGVKPSPRGGAGTQRRFMNADLRRLIQAAETGPYRKGKAIGAAWRLLLSAN